MLDFSDFMRTGISILTSTADHRETRHSLWKSNQVEKLTALFNIRLIRLTDRMQRTTPKAIIIYRGKIIQVYSCNSLFIVFLLWELPIKSKRELSQKCGVHIVNKLLSNSIRAVTCSIVKLQN